MATPLTPVKTGVAYRLELASWVMSRPPEVAMLEITAEHFYRVGSAPLQRLAASYPLIVSTSRLSLGTPGPLDRTELDAFGRVAAAAEPLWICDHLGFRRTGALDLGGPQPVALTAETLTHFVEHGREVMARYGKRLLLGNIASHLRVSGAIPEPEFLNRFCAQTGGGVALDLTNLTVNARNHRFDPRAWLRSVEPGLIAMLRAGGCAREDSRWVPRHDTAIDEGVWDLVAEACRLAPEAARILVRDANLPSPADLSAELRRLGAVGASSADAVPGDATRGAR